MANENIEGGGQTPAGNNSGQANVNKEAMPTTTKANTKISRKQK